MPNAICIECGTAKAAPWAACPKCHFVPQESTDAFVKSVYLSLGRFEDKSAQDQYKNELVEMSLRIREGYKIDFEPAELDRLRDQKDLANAVSNSTLVFTLTRFFLPGLAFLLLLLLVILILRAAK